MSGAAPIDTQAEQLRRHLQLRPDDIAAWAALGARLLESGANAEAIACFDRVLAAHPGHLPTRLNRGICLLQQGDLAAAASEASELCRQVPGHPVPLRLAAEAALGLGQPAEAADRARSGLQLEPTDPALWYVLASALDEQRRFTEALAACEKSLALQPDPPQSLALAQFLRRRLCRFAEVADGTEALQAAIARGDPGVSPFNMLAETDDPQLQLRAARLAAAATAPVVVGSRQGMPPAVTATGLRVGFVSNGFGQHPTALLLAALVEQLRVRHSDIELFGYALNADDGGPLRARLDAAMKLLRSVDTRSTAALYQTVVDDRIDILFDLRGWGGGGRPQLFASRPAPLQVNWLAYPGTSGAPWMDVILADGFVIPPGSEHHYSERVVRLPHCFQPSDTTRAIGPAPSRPDCGLPLEGTVFASFNNSYKIAPDVFSRWLQILERCPGSVLWLLIPDGGPDVETALRREAASGNLDPARLVFAAKAPHAEYLARYGRVDLFLDTLPYGAHTTASDALWAGAPVLTLPGQSFASRVCGSLLHTLGLNQLIAADGQDYIDRAVRLGRDAGALATLRQQLAEARRTSPLFDMTRFADDFATCLRDLASQAQQTREPSR